MKWAKGWRKYSVIGFGVIFLGLLALPSTVAHAIALIMFLGFVGSMALSEWSHTMKLRGEMQRIIETTKPPSCRNCGYDLRASTGRCPECGMEHARTPESYLPISPMARRVIERAELFARECESDHVGTEHLLVALFSERDGVAAVVLADLGVEIGDVLAQMADVHLKKVIPIEQPGA